MKNKENKKRLTQKVNEIKDTGDQLEFKYENEEELGDKRAFKRQLATKIQRKSKKIFTLLIMCGFSFLMACNYTGKKAKETDSIQVDKAVNMSNDEFIADVDNFRIITNETLSMNDKSISIINIGFTKDSSGQMVDYKSRIELCEQKNDELKNRINDYSVNSQENWLWFKSEFNKDVKELDLELKGLLIESSNKAKL